MTFIGPPLLLVTQETPNNYDCWGLGSLESKNSKNRLRKYNTIHLNSEEYNQGLTHGVGIGVCWGGGIPLVANKNNFSCLCSFSTTLPFHVFEIDWSHIQDFPKNNTNLEDCRRVPFPKFPVVEFLIFPKIRFPKNALGVFLRFF